MKKQDPKPGQKVWVWSYKYGCPREMTYLSRCGAWRKWRRFEPDFGETREINLNGLPKWYHTDHECAWAQFAFCVNNPLPAVVRKPSLQVEDAFAYACEYVRRLADSLSRPAGDVWDEGQYPIRDALKIAREAVEAGAVDEIYLSRLRDALCVVFPPEQIVATALREAARVPEVNASNLLAEVLEECGIRTGTAIDRKDLENMAASLSAKLAATSAAARGVGQCTDDNFGTRRHPKETP